jgi:hypothetical protein
MLPAIPAHLIEKAPVALNGHLMHIPVALGKTPHGFAAWLTLRRLMRLDYLLPDAVQHMRLALCSQLCRLNPYRYGFTVYSLLQNRPTFRFGPSWPEAAGSWG